MKRDTRALFEATLVGDYEAEQAWEAVRELRRRNTAEVFAVASEFCHSANPRARQRGLDVLAQLGAGNPREQRPFEDGCVTIALAHLNDEDSEVAESAAWALSHLRTQRGVDALIGLRRHTSPGVRQAVAIGIVGSDRPEVLPILIQLMQDADDEVRNWATFGLGTQRDADSEEIRNALRERLDDQFEEVRDEALWGLALRQDLAALHLLFERFNSEEWIEGDITAAARILNVPSETPVVKLRDGLRRLLPA